MMEIEILLLLLVKILTVAVMGAICALFSFLLDYTFWNGSIFQNYLPWLGRTLLKWKRPNDYREVMMLPPGEARDTQAEQRASKVFMFEMLGGCIVCTNVWIAMISFVAIHFISMGFPSKIGWFYSLPYILTSSTVLRKIMRH